MRIAVSGTHCSGKSVLVASFLAAHRDFVHEPEPYEWLVELYGDVMGDEPSADDFYRQLELSVERLCSYSPGARVIAERCPVDFVAYLLALGDLGRTRADRGLIASATELAATGMGHVDLLVVLPLNAAEGIVAPASEDLELRDAMNDRLLELISTDSTLGGDSSWVIEASGTPAQRLRILEDALRNGRNRWDR